MAENNANVLSDTSELKVRRDKLANLYESGKNPFEITKYDTTHSAPEAKALFEEKEATLGEGEEIKVDMQDVEDTAESEEQVEMSPAKRTTVKILSAILIIILFCLVIWGTDFFTGFLTGFFK